VAAARGVARILGEAVDDARQLARAIEHDEVTAAFDARGLHVRRIAVAERMRRRSPLLLPGPRVLAEDGEERREQMAHAQ
jgi:hypothetical protein